MGANQPGKMADEHTALWAVCWCSSCDCCVYEQGPEYGRRGGSRIKQALSFLINLYIIKPVRSIYPVCDVFF